MNIEKGRWSHQTSTYHWAWDPEQDLWTLDDSRGRTIVRGPLRPRFLMADATADPAFVGTPVTAEARPDQLILGWQGPEGRVVQGWRFADDHFALAPLEARSSRSQDWARLEELAGLTTHYALLPGLSMSPGISPVVDLHSKLNLTTTLGAGAMRGPGLAQQWGLPAHWFAVYNTADRWNAAGSRDQESDALCIGLADLPEGDFWVRTGDRSLTPILNLRSDLWNLYPNGQEHKVGLDLLFFPGKNLEEAPRAWYHHLAHRGLIAGSAYPSGPRIRDVRTWTLFNTWGSQVSEPIQPEQLDQARLEAYWRGLNDSGMRVNLFVIDDKWEGAYGILRHDEARFPDFLGFLDRIRRQGRKVGLWAAFLRCEDPTRVGLTEAHLMKDREGRVLWFQHQSARYGIYDITHPEVAPVLVGLARQFMETYRPDLIKFDFGYELPTLDVAVPHDRRFRGEKLLRRGLEVLLGAMKAVNPDLVVMYYGLSPLLAPFYDLHSIDDVVYGPRDYDVEGNRRMTLASLLGEVGMPVCSSTGYDWASAPDLWFDAAALGAPGSLLPFGPDEAGGGPSPQAIAFFNGLSSVIRPSPRFTARTLAGHPHGGHRALITRSWRREEEGKTFLLALRTGTPVADLTYEGSLVLASLDGLALDQSRHLGLVPWGPGWVRFVRETPGPWRVVRHHLNGSDTAIEVEAVAGLFTLSFDSQDGELWTEWIELAFGGTETKD